MSVVLFVLIPLAAVCAVLLLGTGTNTKLKGDAAIAMLSVFGAVFGIIISIFTSTPLGSTIVTIYILIFIINCIIGRILRI